MVDPFQSLYIFEDGKKKRKQFRKSVVDAKLKKQGSKCKGYKYGPKRYRTTCNMKFKQGEGNVMEMDHKDGKSSNNNPTNLQLVCANCHKLKTDKQEKGKRKKLQTKKGKTTDMFGNPTNRAKTKKKAPIGFDNWL